eukprot:1930129-Pyramimonas_sp.AAC.1
MCIRDRSKTAQDGPAGPPVGPKKASKALRLPKTALRRPQDCPQTPTTWPRGSQDGTREPLDGLRGPQDGPRGPLRPTGGQDSPKMAPPLSIRAPQTKKAKSVTCDG